MNKINRKEISLYSFLDHLYINHREIMRCFIIILLEYKKNSFTKIFFPRNIQIRLRSESGFQKNFKSKSNPDQRKIAGYPFRIRSKSTPYPALVGVC